MENEETFLDEQPNNNLAYDPDVPTKFSSDASSSDDSIYHPDGTGDKSAKLTDRYMKELESDVDISDSGEKAESPENISNKDDSLENAESCQESNESEQENDENDLNIYADKLFNYEIYKKGDFPIEKVIAMKQKGDGNIQYVVKLFSQSEIDAKLISKEIIEETSGGKSAYELWMQNEHKYQLTPLFDGSDYYVLDLDPVHKIENVEKAIYYDVQTQLYIIKWKGLEYQYCSWSPIISEEAKQDFINKLSRIDKESFPNMSAFVNSNSIFDNPQLLNDPQFLQTQLSLMNKLKKNYSTNKSFIVQKSETDQYHDAVSLFLNEMNQKIYIKGPFLIVCSSESINQWKTSLDKFTKLETIVMDDAPANCEVIIKYELTDPEQRPDSSKIQILIITTNSLVEYTSTIRQINWKVIIVNDDEIFKDSYGESYNSLFSIKTNFSTVLTNYDVKNLDKEKRYNILHYCQPSKFENENLIDENLIQEYVLNNQLTPPTDSEPKLNETEPEKIIEDQKPKKEENNTEEENPEDEKYNSLFITYEDPHKDDIWTPDTRDILLNQLLIYGWGRWREIRKSLPPQFTLTMVNDGCSVILYIILDYIEDKAKLINSTVSSELIITRRQQWYLDGPVFGNDNFKSRIKREANAFAKRLICLSALTQSSIANTLNIKVEEKLPFDSWSPKSDASLLHLVYTHGWGNWRDILRDKTWKEQPLSELDPKLVKSRFEAVIDSISGYGTKVKLSEPINNIFENFITSCRIISIANPTVSEEDLKRWLCRVKNQGDKILSFIKRDMAYDIKSNYDFLKRIQTFYQKVGGMFDTEKDLIERLCHYRRLTNYSQNVDGLRPILSDQELQSIQEIQNIMQNNGVPSLVASDMSFFACMKSVRNRAEKAVKSLGGWRGVPDYVDVQEGTAKKEIDLPYPYQCGEYNCTIESLGEGAWFMIGSFLVREGMSIFISNKTDKFQIVVESPSSFIVTNIKDGTETTVNNLIDVYKCGINEAGRSVESLLGLDCNEVVTYFDSICTPEVRGKIGLKEYISPIFMIIPRL